MGHFAAIVVPEFAEFAEFGGVFSYDVLRTVIGETQCPQHHILVIPQQHMGVGHRHDLLQNLNPVRVTIDHIAEDIEVIVRLKVDPRWNQTLSGCREYRIIRKS